MEKEVKKIKQELRREIKEQYSIEFGLSLLLSFFVIFMYFVITDTIHQNNLVKWKKESIEKTIIKIENISKIDGSKITLKDGSEYKSKYLTVLKNTLKENSKVYLYENILIFKGEKMFPSSLNEIKVEKI